MLVESRTVHISIAVTNFRLVC